MNDRKIKNLNNTIGIRLLFIIAMTLEVSALPVLTEIKKISNSTTYISPNYEFNSTEAGKISLNGTCGSVKSTEATVGKNMIVFSTLSVNAYEGCTLTVTSKSNETSNVLPISAFVIEKTKKENNERTDTIKPVIKLNSQEKIFLPRGQRYIEEGATAIDDVDGNLTSDIIINDTSLNINIDGVYYIAYTVSDAANNTGRRDRKVIVGEIKIGVDTDNDGTPDVQDFDDDNDDVLDEHDAFPLDAKETIDLDGDGIGDNADTDDDGNGIEDAQEQTWISYKHNLAIISRSRLEVQGLQVIPLVSGDIFTLVHNISKDQNVYLSSTKTGEVFTGFKSGTIDDSTLESGIFFKSGTTSVIKMDVEPAQLLIQTRAKFNKNDTFEIGGK